MSAFDVVSQIAGQVAALDECIALVKNYSQGARSASGPHGRVLRDVGHILKSMKAPGAIVGGLAVIHHGYHRYTRDVDIVLPAEVVPEFLRIAPLKGFRVARKDRYGWHALVHKETGMDLHLVPEGVRPRKRAPTTIPGPRALGATGAGLGFATLARLIELKVASRRLKDQADVVELVKQNQGQLERIQGELARIHPTLATEFDRLVAQARKESAQEYKR